jgi:hypothetical protein
MWRGFCMNRWRVVMLLGMALAVACDDTARPVLVSQESDRFSFTGFLDGIGKYPYEADQEKQARVIAGFGRLVPGLSMDDVAKSMGNPDAEFLNSISSKTGNKLAYTTWAYYLRRHDRDRFKEGFDQAVFVHFKPNGEVYWADPASTPGLIRVGSPDLHLADRATK